MNAGSWIALAGVLVPVLLCGVVVVATLRTQVKNLAQKIDDAVVTLTGELGKVSDDLTKLTAALTKLKVNEARDLERLKVIDERQADHDARLRDIERVHLTKGCV